MDRGEENLGSKFRKKDIFAKDQSLIMKSDQIRTEGHSLDQRLENLERFSASLEPLAEYRRAWNEQVFQYGEQFLENLEEAKTYEVEGDKGLGLLAATIQEEGRSLEDLLDLFRKHVDEPGANPAGPGMVAYIPGGGIVPAALGDYLAAITNNYAGIFFSGPGAVVMENQLLRWMCQMVGFPDTALGNLTSGGSIANLTAIATARDFKNITPSKIEKSVIYLSQQTHHSIQKALRIAGLGAAHTHYLPLDDGFRIRPDALREAIQQHKAEGLHPFLLVVSAGTTDTGAIDPMEELGAIAREEDLWYHVDAAYGGFFLLVDELRPAFKGIELADSLTIDPHKGLFLPYGTGAVLIKNIEALKKTHYYIAGYMQDAADAVEELSPADLSPELTKHFRGPRMWLPLQLLGVKPFRASLEEKILLCRYFYDRIQELGFEVGPYPELSVMTYRYLPPNGDANEFNAQLTDRIRTDGRVFISSTTIKGTFWLRLAILNFRTHKRHIDLALDIIEEQLTKLV